MMKVENVKFSYGNTQVLNGVTFEVDDGEIVTLLGPNGSGKTTLLRCMAKLLKPSEGYISIDGKELGEIGLKDLAREVAYVPQYIPNVFPITVFEAVLMGRIPYMNLSPTDGDIEIVYRTLEMIGIEEFASRYIDELSGGERQKVFIARAIAQKARILLLDEPTSNLDLKHQLKVMNLITNLVRREGTSILMATQDLNLASKHSDKVVMLNNGKVLCSGKPEDVINEANIAKVYGVRAKIVNNDGFRLVHAVDEVDVHG